MTGPERRGTITRFGMVVMSLVTEHGVRSQRALADLLSGETEHAVSPHHLGRCLRGEHEPPWWFCEALADLLDLSDEELEKLAMANTYGQRTYLGGVA